MKTKEIPGWWSSQILGRKDPYEAWMPNVMVSTHNVPRDGVTKRRFRELCRQAPDRYGIYYDLVFEDERRTQRPSAWATVYKLYAPIRVGGISHVDLTNELVAVLENRTTRGSPKWVTRWTKKYGCWKKAIRQMRL